MTSRTSLAGLALLLVAVGPAGRPLRADSDPYTVQDAGPPSGVAYAVNADAVVAGASGAPGARVAFVTPFGSGPQPLPGLVGSPDSLALGVHPDGWAVGASVDGFYARPVSFQSGSAVDLAPAALTGEARAVNAAGAIAGWAFDNGTKAIVWHAGASAVVPGTFYAQAFAINDAGLVTGTYFGTDGTLHAFRWSGTGDPAVLPTLGGFTSEGLGINEAGDVVGDSMRPSSFDEQAVLWRAGGTLVELGTFGGSRSSARDVNNHGQIVGYAQNAGGEPRAFLSEDGGPLVDLNDRLEAGSGWVLLSANAINDAGQIAGEGLLNGEPRAFLLTPPVASDTTPPVIDAVTTTPSGIWPPKHQMVDVAVTVSASDDSGETPTCSVTGVTSSESDNTGGDGNTSGDAEVTGAASVRVRAERSGPSGVRLYTIAVQCSDPSGNVATGAGTVTIGEGSAVAMAKKGRR
jgi:probable HAF family extracellular repeat protein